MAAGVAISVGSQAHRAELARLLGAQLEEHAIAIEATRLEAAIAGVMADGSRGRFLILSVDGEAVGVAYLSFIWALEHGGLAAWLEELYVRPAWRGRGLGARLLGAALDEARAAGCAAVDLEVEASHARAARLYQRAGFTRHRRERWVRRLDA